MLAPTFDTVPEGCRAGMGEAHVTPDPDAGTRPESDTAATVMVPLLDARQSLGAARLDDLFPVGPAFRKSLETFVVLLALAALIATFGLYEDSVAAIIGAMVVAPLGGAIMALAGALVTGRTRWQTITFVQVVLGSLMVVAIAWVVAWVIPQPLVLNASILARTSPGLLDLGVALAAGAAGAWVAIRRTGADALPGVAIAVSLVPPLATVGICIRLGRLDEARGALTLFLTNFAAITVVASIVFVLCGATPSREMLRERHRLRNGFAVAMAALVIVAAPLAQQGVDRIETTIRSTDGAPLVRAWIGQRRLEVQDWAISGPHVRLTLRGPDAPAAAGLLATALSHAFGAPVDLHIDYQQATWTDASAHP